MWRLFTGFGNISKHILSVDGEHFTKFIKKRLGKMFENLFKYHFLESKMLEIYCSTVQNPVGDCMETITPIILFLIQYSTIKPRLTMSSTVQYSTVQYSTVCGVTLPASD